MLAVWSVFTDIGINDFEMVNLTKLKIDNTIISIGYNLI